MKTFISLIVLLSVLSLSNAQSIEQEITAQLNTAYENSSLPGFAAALISKDEILYQKGFGYSDLANKTPFTIHTIENIGSISKTLIGVSLMKAVEDKLLNLDDPVNKYLPFKVIHPKYPKEVITIRHLATHTSGIKDRNANYGMKSYYLKDELNTSKRSKKGLSIFQRWYLKKIGKNKKLSLEEYLSNVFLKKGKWYSKKNFYASAPGKAYNYSNIGAALTAFIIERATGVSFDVYSQKHIVKPLQMNASGWKHKDVNLEKWATHYIGKKNAILPFYDLSTYPDGSFKSSIADLSLYVQAMIKGYYGEDNVLKSSSFEVLFKNQLPENFGKQSAVFWDIFGKDKKGAIGHGGGDPGITTIIYFNPKTQIGKILITNCSEKESEFFAIWEQLVEMEKLYVK